MHHAIGCTLLCAHEHWLLLQPNARDNIPTVGYIYRSKHLAYFLLPVCKDECVIIIVGEESIPQARSADKESFQEQKRCHTAGRQSRPQWQPGACRQGLSGASAQHCAAMGSVHINTERGRHCVSMYAPDPAPANHKYAAMEEEDAVGWCGTAMGVLVLVLFIWLLILAISYPLTYNAPDSWRDEYGWKEWSRHYERGSGRY